ncbi:hypothetical protein QUA13_02045 [Microcoleus sp. S28C3]|uniref:DUF6766 family protein n=1 Tax=Microcoleus sp. S28C3 TaxID=3055414 RepID=UPI002FD0DC81
MRRFFRENSLSLVMFGLFFFSLVGQILTGHRDYSQELKDHKQPPIGVVEYLGSGHFIEAVFENWESEFLQMGMYVLLTAFLCQKGSPESRKPEGEEAVDAEPGNQELNPKTPWPVRQGGLSLKVYENSLTLALFLLFFLSFALHAVGGAKEYSQEQIQHGEKPVSAIEYLGTSRFWFESFQNWQSEFLSIGTLAVLSVFLRQKGSPESKPVDRPNDETGKD